MCFVFSEAFLQRSVFTIDLSMHAVHYTSFLFPEFCVFSYYYFFSFSILFCCKSLTFFGLEPEILHVQVTPKLLAEEMRFEQQHPRLVLSSRNTRQAKSIISKFLVTMLKIKETGELISIIYFI